MVASPTRGATIPRYAPAVAGPVAPTHAKCFRLVLFLASALATTMSTAACNSTAATGAPSPSAPETVETLAPTATPRSTVSTSPTPESPITFESVMYPYALTTQPHVLHLTWKAATRAWDGTERLYFHVSPLVDTNSTDDGSLYLFGLPWTDDLASFAELVEENTGRFLGCGPLSATRDATVGEVPAIAFRQECGPLRLSWIRVMFVGQGYGITVSAEVDTGNEIAAIDHMLELLTGFAWRAA